MNKVIIILVAVSYAVMGISCDEDRKYQHTLRKSQAKCIKACSTDFNSSTLTNDQRLALYGTCTENCKATWTGLVRER